MFKSVRNLPQKFVNRFLNTISGLYYKNLLSNLFKNLISVKTTLQRTIYIPLLLFLHGSIFGKSKAFTIFFTSLTRSLTFSWCAVRCAVTKRNEVPNIINAVPTAPFVRKALPGLTERLASSAIETYQIRSLRIKVTRCRVPMENQNVY